jgi:DeoR/GlpR family transcriptional regulator of sugar metabolism
MLGEPTLRRTIRRDLETLEADGLARRVRGGAISVVRRSVVLADGSKLGRVAFATVAPLSAVDAVVTDTSAAHQAVRELAAAGAEVIEARVPDAVESQSAR